MNFQQIINFFEKPWSLSIIWYLVKSVEVWLESTLSSRNFFIISNNILTIFVHRYAIPHFHLWYQWLGPLLQWVSSRIDGFWAVWTNIYPIFFVHTLHNEGIVKKEVALLAHCVEFAFHIQWCAFEILQKTFLLN